MYHILTGYVDGGCSRLNLLNDRKAAFKTVSKAEGRGRPFIGAGFAIQPFTAAHELRGPGGREVEFINCLFDGCCSGTTERGQLVYMTSGHHTNTQRARLEVNTTQKFLICLM